MLNLRTAVSGEGESDLVLLHGWGMGRLIWSPLLPLLEARYRVHNVDLPGYGDNVDVSASSIETAARQVLAVVPDRAHWIGWSMGGMVALKAASIAPRSLGRLTMVASSPRFVADDDWPYAIPAEQLHNFADGLMSDLVGTLSRFVALQFYGMSDVRSVIRQLQQMVVDRPVDRLALAAGLSWLLMEDLRAEFASLLVPAGLVLGAMDGLVPSRVSRDLAALNPDVSCVVMKRIGHAPFVTAPELFFETVFGCET